MTSISNCRECTHKDVCKYAFTCSRNNIRVHLTDDIYGGDIYLQEDVFDIDIKCNKFCAKTESTSRG